MGQASITWVLRGQSWGFPRRLWGAVGKGMPLLVHPGQYQGMYLARGLVRTGCLCHPIWTSLCRGATH